MQHSEHAGLGLRAMRKGLGISQRELARRAHVSHSFLAAVERGETVPTQRWMRAVLEAIVDATRSAA